MFSKYLPFIVGLVFIIILVMGVVIFRGFTSPKNANNQMEKQKLQQLESEKASKPSTTSQTQTKYTLEEIAKHNNQNDCWLVISNNVYNVTSFIPKHPGGKEILKGCGKDATKLFQGEDEHQERNAASYLPEYLIGSID